MEEIEGPQHPWDQLPGEPDLWYTRFTQYRLLGTSRSIRKAEISTREQAGKTNHAQSATNGWYTNYKKWEWYQRAIQWDRWLLENAESEINETWTHLIMGREEILGRLSEHARVNISDFFITRELPLLDSHGNALKDSAGVPMTKTAWEVNYEEVKSRGYLVKSITETRYGTRLELHDGQSALIQVGKHRGLFLYNEQGDEKIMADTRGGFQLPADVLAPNFLNVYRDLVDKNNTEYVLTGGRGSTKSSFASLALIYIMLNNPEVHVLALRQVAATLRDSVFAQLNWAIAELGLMDQFKSTTSPMEITRSLTGQKIFFRGADDPNKIKSIKPSFGYIGALWFEELDQFHGPESVRKIEQSAIRGGSMAITFKTFNPPRTIGNWANKYILIPKPGQLVHRSNYLEVPIKWLGQPFVDEAAHLKNVNEPAYEHEYLGVVNGTGGMIFENVRLNEITDEEIAQFDRVTCGLDFGYYPDPAHFSKVHYDAARMTLYIFGEHRAWKRSNRAMYDEIIETKLLSVNDLMIADSAEPKSVADYREFGANCRGAEKGPESVKYSIKWLQGLRAIVIDPTRCPHTAEEFATYEYLRDKDDNFISSYPDKDNHAIDSVRYATNRTWQRRGS
jgi:PBSX family phage terminase large subunit